MNIFIGLDGHANNSSLPLRMGIRLTQPQQQYAVLLDALFDEAATKSQRQSEIDDGRKHYTGELRIVEENRSSDRFFTMRCRVVLAEPQRQGLLPALVTVLDLDNVMGDLTVTKHIEGMLKRGRINSGDLLSIFHPAYRSGRLKSSNDCEEVFEQEVRVGCRILPENDSTISAMLSNPVPVVSALEQVASDEVHLKAPMLRKPLPIYGVKYKYEIVDAYIENVRKVNDRVELQVVDDVGRVGLMHSFKFAPRPHLLRLQDSALTYFKQRERQRAIFAVCVTEPCVGYIAESVTAIALQLMRAGYSEAMNKGSDRF